MQRSFEPEFLTTQEEIPKACAYIVSSQCKCPADVSQYISLTALLARIPRVAQRARNESQGLQVFKQGFFVLIRQSRSILMAASAVSGIQISAIRQRSCFARLALSGGEANVVD